MILALISTLLLALSPGPEGEVRDSLKASEVTASLKFTGALFQQPVAATEVSMKRLEEDRIRSVGDLSAVAPNFFQPRYGSHITSSIYFRGFGSRIDQPVVGVYLDDVPLLNKNAYDFDFLDLRRAQVLRGPQSVLFGRNTSLGVIRLESLSPFDWTGVRASAEAASNGSWKASSSLFQRPSERLGWSLSVAFSHEGGDFVNAYTGKRCDTGNSLSLKSRVQWLRENGWFFSNNLQANILKEGGYAYGLLEDGMVLPVNYNDPSGYRRLHVLDGFSARKSLSGAELSAAVSWQFLADRMDMDNDFTPASIFSLTQKQREHGLTAEVLIRNHPGDDGWRRLYVCDIGGEADSVCARKHGFPAGKPSVGHRQNLAGFHHLQRPRPGRGQDLVGRREHAHAAFLSAAVGLRAAGPRRLLFQPLGREPDQHGLSGFLVPEPEAGLLRQGASHPDRTKYQL